MVLVPWCDMKDWIDWLDTMAPDWDFAYGGGLTIDSMEFSLQLLFDYEAGGKNNPRCAHMRVGMTEEQMMLHKLTWDVDNIADNERDLVG